MATDLSAVSVPEFTTAVTVPTDGDTFDAAAIATMILPLVNRTDFLDSGHITTPWKVHEGFDDFTFAKLSAAGDILHTAEGNWFFQQSGGAAFTENFPAVSTETVGVVEFRPTVAAGGGLWMRHSFDQYRWPSIRRIDIRLAYEDVDTIVGRNFEIGFVSDSDASVRSSAVDNETISIIKHSSIGVGYYLRRFSSNVETTELIPLSTTAAGTFHQLSLFHDGVGNFTASFNGGTPSAALAMPLTGTCTFGLKYEVPAAGARNIQIDFTRTNLTLPSRNI